MMSLSRKGHIKPESYKNTSNIKVCRRMQRFCLRYAFDNIIHYIAYDTFAGTKGIRGNIL